MKPASAHEKAKPVDASVHLDAIRGLAALAVFLSHSRGIFLKSGLRDALTGSQEGPDMPTAGASVLHNHFQLSSLLAGHQSIGRFAVIVFFVLSGYFVGGSVLRSQRQGRFSWGDYFLQRMTRLWVVLIPALLLTLLLDLSGSHWFASSQNIYHQPLSPYGTGLEQRLTWTAFWGNLFFLQGIVTPTFGTNEPLWSLAYEFWYYALFPLFLIAILPSKSAWKRLASAAIFLALLILCGWNIAVYFAIWGAGVIAALVPLRLSPRAASFAVKCAALALFSTMFLALKVKMYHFVGDLMLAAVSSAALWTVLHMKRVSVNRVYRELAQGMSRMSYTLYLVHLPLLVFASALIAPVWAPQPLSVSSFGLMLGIDLAVFGLAWVMYVAFERNTAYVRRWLAKISKRRETHVQLTSAIGAAREYS